MDTPRSWRGALALLTVAALAAGADDAAPEPAKHRVLVELFTSQG